MYDGLFRRIGLQDAVAAKGRGDALWVTMPLTLLLRQANAYVHVTKIKAWDVCAAEALVTAVGGAMTDTAGNTLMYGKDSPAFTHGLVASATAEAQAWYVEQLQQAGQGYFPTGG